MQASGKGTIPGQPSTVFSITLSDHSITLLSIRAIAVFEIQARLCDIRQRIRK
jgi:hypothetical protein